MASENLLGTVIRSQLLQWALCLSLERGMSFLCAAGVKNSIGIAMVIFSDSSGVRGVISLVFKPETKVTVYAGDTWFISFSKGSSTNRIGA
ncbi:hypothetical protein [Roseibium album]|uniref:hypothetical protein n=1 Tax=Roseibium album TaxID=311410 RepID=UPI002490674F|nr:hypothetical protein [Roseibium album]